MTRWWGRYRIEGRIGETDGTKYLLAITKPDVVVLGTKTKASATGAPDLYRTAAGRRQTKQQMGEARLWAGTC
jgi:hypothetical protein